MNKRLLHLSSLNHRTFYSLMAVIAAAFCLIIGFSRKPQLYPIDYGQYEMIMRDAGLTWTAEDIAQGGLQYSRPLTHFAYTDISWFRLLTPRAGSSLVYPIALIRIFTEPLGLDFSVNALAFVLSLILLICVYLQMGYLYKLFPKYAFFPIIGMCLIFTDSNFCAILRGLYPQGVMIVYTVLYITALLGYFASEEKKRLPHMFATAVSSVLLLRADSHMIVFLPALILMGIYIIIREKNLLSKHLGAAVITIVLSCAYMLRAFTVVGTDPDIVSEAASYSSVFNTMLPNSGSPSVIIKEFGLDESYLNDIGRSYYESAESFVHDPHNEVEAEKLFEKISPSNILFTYLRHPVILSQACSNYPYKASSYENIRNSALSSNSSSFSEFRNPAGITGIIRNIFHPDYFTFRIVILLMSLPALYEGIVKKKRSWLFVLSFLLCAALYLPFITVFGGYTAGAQPILYQVFLQDLLLPVILALILHLCIQLRVWMLKNSSEPFVPAESIEELPAEGNVAAIRLPKVLDTIIKKVSALAGSIFNSPVKTALFFSCMALIMLLMVFLPAEHPATVNNGDYGRMMKQLDLSWVTENHFDTSSQVLHKAIEQYVYLEPFNPLKLTPIKPTYTLYWFASIVRLLTEPFGQPFSTRLLAIVMGGIIIACIAMIVHDLHPHCGKWTCLIGFLLSALLLSETYLTWLNSLYGEGTIIAGLMLSLMCTVHLLAAQPKKPLISLLWLLGLGISLSIMCGAKSQMLLAAPGACLLFLFVAWCCRPYRYDLQAVWIAAAVGLCAVLTVGAIGVYRSDRDETSVSQRHTMWQAYFYGIFMISDDPIKDMQELGIDTAMAADIGKYVQFDQPEIYVYAPLSEEAGPAFYDHVSIGTIVSWYLRHPTKLWYMLDRAASEAKELYTGFRVYTDEDYLAENRREVNGFDLWPGWRGSFTPHSFLGYVILYLLIIFASVRIMKKRDLPMPIRLMPVIAFFLMITGGLQFPLSILGNGFADYHKQLFAFSLCHDLLLCMAICYVIYRLKTYRRVDHEKSNGSVRDQAGSDQDVPAGTGTEEKQEA